MTTEQLRNLNFIVDHYGSANQLEKSQEELSELITEISRYNQNPDEPHRRGNIIDELSDVMVMCNQLMIIFNCFGEVEERIDFKINRQLERIKNEV